MLGEQLDSGLGSILSGFVQLILFYVFLQSLVIDSVVR